MDTRTKISIGSHVSCSSPDYLLGSVNEALSYNASALMLYTGAPQNSKRIPIENMKVEEAVQKWQQAGYDLKSMIIHAPYIINLANTINPDTFELGKRTLLNEILRTQAIGAKYLILHPGSYLTATLEQGIDSIASGLNEILSQTDGSVMVCLETMAGKGKEVGFRFEQIKEIIDRVNYPLGVCLDSCHIWDAGYDLNNTEEILKEFDSIIGLDQLYVLHINDSKNILGARKDRHENIGKGAIGFENLHTLVHHPLLKDKVFILETPYIDGKAPYKEEIEALRG